MTKYKKAFGLTFLAGATFLGSSAAEAGKAARYFPIVDCRDKEEKSIVVVTGDSLGSMIMMNYEYNEMMGLLELSNVGRAMWERSGEDFVIGAKGVGSVRYARDPKTEKLSFKKAGEDKAVNLTCKVLDEPI